MLRFASTCAVLLLRLAIVLSLAGYSSFSANAAMHPDLLAQVTQIATDHVVAHSEHDGEKHHGKDSKQLKDTCCQDFCGVNAINCGGVALKHPRAQSSRAFVDDSYLGGLSPRIDLPPDI